MQEKISLDELNLLLDQELVNEEDLERVESFFHLIENSPQNNIDLTEYDEPSVYAQNKSLEPRIELNLDAVETQEANIGRAILIKLKNAFRNWRQKRFHEKINFFDQENLPYIKIVSDGDSWFQFPLILDDIIDQIFEPRQPFSLNRDNPYSVFCLGEAGARLENIVRQEQYLESLREIKPEWFLISGGGNDLLDGGKGVSDLIIKFPEEIIRPPEEYIRIEKLHERIQVVMELYRQLFQNILDQPEFNQIKIICYGYDYVRPKRNGWILGLPLRRQNINNETTMFEIMKVIIDHFNDALETLVAEVSSTDRLFYIDCRGSVSAEEWFDDFHPKSSGFESVAQRFISKIKEIQG